jgi:VCBS repeat-containing protein
MAISVKTSVPPSSPPLATNDSYTGVYEDTTNTEFNVLANDKGGNAAFVYSLDQNLGDGLQVITSTQSSLGATITILSDGNIGYNATGAQLEALAAGQTITDTFTYTMRVANGAVSTATVTVTVKGTNDGPTVVGAQTTATGSITELPNHIGSNAPDGASGSIALRISATHIHCRRAWCRRHCRADL